MIKKLLALLLPLAALANPTITITNEFASVSGPKISVFAGNSATIQNSFTVRGQPYTNISSPYMWYAKTSGSTNYVPAVCTNINSNSFIAYFHQTNIATKGIFVYGVGCSNSDGSLSTFGQGQFEVGPDAYATGAQLTNFLPVIDWNLYTWRNVPFASSAIDTTGRTWTVSASNLAVNAFDVAVLASNLAASIPPSPAPPPPAITTNTVLSYISATSTADRAYTVDVVAGAANGVLSFFTTGMATNGTNSVDAALASRAWLSAVVSTNTSTTTNNFTLSGSGWGNADGLYVWDAENNMWNNGNTSISAIYYPLLTNVATYYYSADGGITWFDDGVWLPASVNASGVAGFVTTTNVATNWVVNDFSAFATQAQLLGYLPTNGNAQTATHATSANYSTNSGAAAIATNWTGSSALGGAAYSNGSSFVKSLDGNATNLTVRGTFTSTNTDVRYGPQMSLAAVNPTTTGGGGFANYRVTLATIGGTVTYPLPILSSITGFTFKVVQTGISGTNHWNSMLVSYATNSANNTWTEHTAFTNEFKSATTGTYSNVPWTVTLPYVQSGLGSALLMKRLAPTNSISGTNDVYLSSPTFIGIY